MRPKPKDGSITFGVYSRTVWAISHGASDAEVARTGLFERLLLNRNQLRGQMELFALLGFNRGTPNWERLSDAGHDRSKRDNKVLTLG